MINRAERIATMVELGKRLKASDDRKDAYIQKAYHENQWFVPDNSRKAIDAICEEYLDEKKLKNWSSQYPDDSALSGKRVGLILAGNIPLVGFHDMLSTFVSGHKAKIKASSKDETLVKLILALIKDINSEAHSYFEMMERLADFDAVIATGSNNTASHFEYYFRNHPKIIRKNRTSVAILDGSEDENSLLGLGNDVFDYFGLGCRNVSKVYLPKGYNTDRLFEAFLPFQSIGNHNKYKNNYDYNEAIWLMGQDEFLTNNFLILKEEKSLHSRISSLYYEYYDDASQLSDMLLPEVDNIQCISTNMSLPEFNTVPLGACQSPGLADYADGVDTMDFLLNL